MVEVERTTGSLYNDDYHLWILETVKQLQDRNLSSLDWDNLIEEVFDLSRRQKRKVQNLLKWLIEHLLKLKYWQTEVERNANHWKSEILNFRQQIRQELEDSPSLRSYLEQILEQSYADAKKIVLTQTSLSTETIPLAPLGNLEELLDETWGLNGLNNEI
jgi:hypothetical protein